MSKISGVYCAAITPINQDFSINKDLYLRHCQSLMRKGLDGLVLFGTNGEASSFSFQEKIECIQFLADNKIDPKKIINYQTLYDLGIVKTMKSKIKLLAKGEIKTKINIEVAAASNSAKGIVEKVGGSITIIENNRLVKTPTKKSGV